MSTPLHCRVVAFDYGDEKTSALVAKVWSGTPFMVNVRTGSPGSDTFREIVSWCRSEFGDEAWPIHDHPGEWRMGGSTFFGETFMGFSTEERMTRFAERFPTLILADSQQAA